MRDCGKDLHCRQTILFFSAAKIRKKLTKYE